MFILSVDKISNSALNPLLTIHALVMVAIGNGNSEIDYFVCHLYAVCQYHIEKLEEKNYVNSVE